MHRVVMVIFVTCRQREKQALLISQRVIEYVEIFFPWKSNNWRGFVLNKNPFIPRSIEQSWIAEDKQKPLLNFNRFSSRFPRLFFYTWMHDLAKEILHGLACSFLVPGFFPPWYLNRKGECVVAVCYIHYAFTMEKRGQRSLLRKSGKLMMTYNMYTHKKYRHSCILLYSTIG